MRPRFPGQTALVTGGSRGLGRAMALAFAGEGAHVVVAYRAHAAEAEATLRGVEAENGSGEALALDVRDPEAVDHAIRGVLERRGAIDILVNNAGVVQDELLPVMSDAAWTDVLATDLNGVFHCARAVARPMIARGRGAIVNVASAAALRASPGQANYAAAKGGVLAFTRSLAAELAPRGVRVNAVVPGLVDAGMGTRLDRRVVERHRAETPLGRLATAQEIASAVLFLASDEASYVVGHALVVDGGMTL